MPDMQDAIEEKVRDLILAALAEVKVFYRGEPGIVPYKLYPFGVVFLDTKREATGEEGYGESTGVRHFRYSGYVAFETVYKDTNALMPDVDRKADVPSYIEAKAAAETAFEALLAWGGPVGQLEQDPVVVGNEVTVELRTDNQHNGLATRGFDNANNRSSFDFHIYTRRTEW